jgi:hypothetical protein
VPSVPPEVPDVATQDRLGRVGAEDFVVALDDVIWAEGVVLGGDRLGLHQVWGGAATETVRMS